MQLCLMSTDLTKLPDARTRFVGFPESGRGQFKMMLDPKCSGVFDFVQDLEDQCQKCQERQTFIIV